MNKYNALVRVFAAIAATLVVARTALAQQVNQSTVDPSAQAQPAQPIVPTTTTTTTATTTSTPPTDEDVVVLSPFEVQASSRDIGYFSENTLAGSRLNTKVSDLASSITIVTKQQLEDTGATDINDIFNYEANTEGSSTYTPYIFNRNGIKDANAGASGDDGTASTNATANRVRGLDAADTSQNNYRTIARIPFDAYNTQSVEINRGPNSLLFGAGSPAGIVNQSTATADLTKMRGQVLLRAGSYDALRASFNINVPIINNMLAVYAAALYDQKGFRQQPSSDETRRQYAALTFKPFKRTTIRANFENYSNDNRRPNSITPRDTITPWLAAGRPMYNPVTRLVTYLDKPGVTQGPYTLATSSPGYVAPNLATDAALTQATQVVGGVTIPNPLYIPNMAFGLGFGGSGRDTMYINQGNLLGYYVPRTQNAKTGITIPSPRTPAQQLIFENRPMTTNFLPVPAGYAAGSWVQPGVNNKDIYDYEHINISSVNFGEQKAQTYNVELEQGILDDLYISAGYFRQNLKATDNYYMGEQQATTLYVDPNLTMPDGSPNPYAGSPYVQDSQADTFKRPETQESYRVMLAYSPDFTKNKNWTKWLGHHRFLALWSMDKHELNNQRYRITYTDGSDPRFLPNMNTNPPNNWSYAGASINRNYYVGQNQTGQVSYAPGYYENPGYGGPTTGNVRFYNWATGSFDNANVNLGTPLFYAGANYGRQINQIESKSIAWQPYLLDDRIIATLGWRRDDVKSRNTVLPSQTPLLYPNGYADLKWLDNLSPWQELTGDTKTYGVVVKPLKWLSFHYNKSDNFNPPSGSRLDFFGSTLPKPQGTGEDYGVSVSLGSKLYVRLNWFKASNENAPATAAATAIGRIQRMDTQSYRSWAEWIVRIRAGQNPTAQNFVGTNAIPLTPAQQNEIAQITGVPYTWPTGLNINGTQQNQSKGMELQVVYNPTQNWNVKLTAGKQESTYDKVAPEADAWLATRQPVWQNATANQLLAAYPQYLVPFSTFGRDPSAPPNVSLANFWSGYGFNSDASVDATNGWTNVANFYENAVATELSVAKSLQGRTVPNERKWTASLISNYTFTQGALRNTTVGGSLRWADRAVAGFFGDPNKKDSNGLIASPDIDNPIYTPEQWYLDLWVSYSLRNLPWFGKKVAAKIQLNARNITENGGLQAIAYNLDGTEAAYRIVEPRTFFVTVTFDF